MKSKLINTFFCILLVGVSAKGQSLNSDEPDFKGDIKNIIEKSVGAPGWWREYDFDSLYRLKEKRYFREYELIKTEKQDYIDTDSLLIIHRQIDDGTGVVVGRPVLSTYSVKKLYFDSDKRIQRQETFSPQDTSHMTIFTNFVFNKNDIVQYNKIHFYNKDTTTVELYEYKYNKNKLSVTIKKTDNYGGDFTQILKYDKKGNLKSVIVDYNNPEVFLGGARTWSRKRGDKYRIDYKYDKHGNWVEKYAVTRLRKYKIHVRIIEYE